MRWLALAWLALATAGPARPEELSPPPTPPDRTHRVQAGETLWQIAARTVGDPTLWPALYLANRDRIKDPARVYPGQELTIPSIDPERVAAIRREAATLTTR